MTFYYKKMKNRKTSKEKLIHLIIRYQSVHIGLEERCVNGEICLNVSRLYHLFTSIIASNLLNV